MCCSTAGYGYALKKAATFPPPPPPSNEEKRLITSRHNPMQITESQSDKKIPLNYAKRWENRSAQRNAKLMGAFYFQFCKKSLRERYFVYGRISAYRVNTIRGIFAHTTSGEEKKIFKKWVDTELNVLSIFHWINQVSWQNLRGQHFFTYYSRDLPPNNVESHVALTHQINIFFV